MAEKSTEQDAPVTIKKYANRRLYNTATSSYVTLDHLCTMVKEGIDFVVYDAKSGDDITHSVLTQIIMEEESKGHNLLPIGFLRQLIGFYGDNLSSFVPRYLEMSMDTFSRNQDEMRSQLDQAFGGFYPFQKIEDMGKANMQMFQNAMEMFAPFTGGRPAGGDGAGGSKTGRTKAATDMANGNKAAADTAPERNTELTELRSMLATMQRQLDDISKKGGK